MKFLLAFTLITFTLTSALVIPKISKLQDTINHSVTAFLKTQILNLRNNDESTLTSIAFPDFDLSQNEEDFSYSFNLSSIEVQNFGKYAVTKLQADLTEGIFSFDLDVTDLAISGNYTLDGLVSSVIALKGQGHVNISSHSVTTVCKGDIVSDIATGIASIRNLQLVSIGSSVKVNFEGIQAGDVIGDLVKNNLEQIGTVVFETVTKTINAQLKTVLVEYVNKAFAEKTVEEIALIKVLDTVSDAEITGWSVDNVDCRYADSLDFDCNDNVSVHLDGRGGNGFWAACPSKENFGDLCALTYRAPPGERILAIQLEAYYSQNPLAESHYEGRYADSDYAISGTFNETGILEFDSNRIMSFLTIYPNRYSADADYTIVDKVTLYTSAV